MSDDAGLDPVLLHLLAAAGPKLWEPIPSAGRQVHMPDGFTPAGGKHRAHCSCGYATTARVTPERATAALTADHALSPPVCALCDRTRPTVDYVGRWADLEILTVEAQPPIEQVLVCRTGQQTCHDLASQKLMHADRAAQEGFGLEPPLPRLRAIDGDAS